MKKDMEELLIDAYVEIIENKNIETLKKEGYLINEIKIRKNFSLYFKEIYDFIKKYNVNYLTYLDYASNKIDSEPLQTLCNPSVYFEALNNAMLDNPQRQVKEIKNEYRKTADLLVQLCNSTLYIIDNKRFIMKLCSAGITSVKKYKSLFKINQSGL